MELTDTISLALIMLPVLCIICGATVVIVRRQSLQHRGISPEDRAQMQGLYRHRAAHGAARGLSGDYSGHRGARLAPQE